MCVVIVSTPEFLKLCPDTNPEGTMFACMLAAGGFYLMMLAKGPSRWMAIGCGAMVALAMSCKEQAVPPAVGVGLGLVALAWPHASTDPSSRVTGFFLLIRTVVYFAIGAGATYLAVNVVYAPHAWAKRMHYLTTSGYMDPDIWSSGSGAFQLGQYLTDTVRAIGVSLGIGGIAGVVLAALRTPRWRAREIAATWLPMVVCMVLVFAKARYMSITFMGNAAMLAIIPAAMALRDIRNNSRLRHDAITVTLVLTPLLLIGMTGPWQSMPMAPSSLITDYLDHHCANGERFHLANLWKLPDDGDLEKLRGLNVDPRPLGVALADRADRPELIIISTDAESFLDEFAQNPKRAKMFSEDGVDYTGFHGFADAGYQLVDTISPRPFTPPQISWLLPFLDRNDIHVYRRATNSAGSSQP
jgi:hypothetical protein